jgi:aspartyl-tRNA(Asn)/glutamyl-tRNA(Gln) amidotransferase subunit A
VPLSSHLDFVGPLARTAVDAAVLLAPILVTGKAEPSLSPIQKFSKRTNRFRLGLPKEFFLDLVSDEVNISFHEAVRSLQKHGMKVKEVSIPLLSETEEAGNHIAWAEATHYHQQAGWFPAHAADYGEDVRARLEMGSKISATDYLRALDSRDKFIQQLHLAMTAAEVDALVVPTSPIAAPLIGEESTTIGKTNHPTRALLLRLNRPANLAGIPAISVPCGFTSAGLPVGLQLIGAVTNELLLLRIAHLFEEFNPQRKRPPIAKLSS